MLTFGAFLVGSDEFMQSAVSVSRWKRVKLNDTLAQNSIIFFSAIMGVEVGLRTAHTIVVARQSTKIGWKLSAYQISSKIQYHRSLSISDYITTDGFGWWL